MPYKLFFRQTKKLIAFIILVGLSIHANAQLDIQIGNGTTGNSCTEYPTPFGHYYDTHRGQYLFLASELTAAGMGAGAILAIKWDVTSLNSSCFGGPAGVNRDFTIKIGTTTVSALSSYVTGLTTVYGPVNYQPVVGRNSFPLSTPFIWNGTDNIVVDVCSGNNSPCYNYTVNASVNYTTTTFNSCWHYWQDCVSSSCNQTSSYTPNNKRPNTIFEYGLPCQGVPTATIEGPTDACANKPFTLSLNPFYTGVTVQWQQSLNNSVWVPATGTVNAANQLTQAINVPTYFRAVITCLDGGAVYTTPVHMVDVSKFYYCYCDQSRATSTNGNVDIGNVRLISFPTGDTLLNNGLATPLYSNASATSSYTDLRRALNPTPIFADTQYRLIVSQINKNATFNPARIAAYLDYNRNGTFDPMERLLLESTSVVPPYPGVVTDTFAITIPAGNDDLYGLTGLRVIAVAGGTDPDTCLSYADGETEDYLIDILYEPCDGIPDAGVIEGDTSMCIGYDYNLIDSTYQKRRHGLSRVWEESADGINWSLVAGSLDKDTLNRVFTGQPKYYRVKIRCSHTGDSAYTAVHKVNVKASYKCYCHSQSMGGAADSSDVGGFTLEDFSYNYGGSHLENPRSWHKRQDFTDWDEIEMFVDSIYEFSVFHTQINKNHGDAKITVFVDFNNNKLYDIPEERIYTGFTSVGNFNRMGQVIIPNTVITNVPTGMRVIINNDVSPNVPSDEACGEYVSGETEDYIVKFVRRFPSSVNAIGSVNNISLYPNPTSGRFTIGFNSVKAGVVKVKVSNVTGQQLLSEVYDETAGSHSHELNLGGHASGIYFVELEADGIKTTHRVVLQ